MINTDYADKAAFSPPCFHDHVALLAVEPYLAGSFVITLRIFAETMTNAVLARCTGTYGHSQRVGVLSYTAALGLGLDRKQADYYYIAGLLHDIGKIGLSDALLEKMLRQECFSYAESLDVREHCRLGAQMIEPISRRMNTLDRLDLIIMHHHEFYDGSGYPSGIKGVRIPLGARIIGCADALASRIEQRCSLDEALSGLSKESQEKHDPYVALAIQKYVAKADVCLKEIRNQQNHAF